MRRASDTREAGRGPLATTSAPADRSKPGLVGAAPRYAIVGASGVLVNLAALWVLHTGLGVPFPLASALATETAILTNYLGNELWTFHHRRLAWARLARFNVTALAGLAGTVAVATAAESLLGPTLGQLAGIAVGAGINYLVNFFWTWAR